ncbi:AP-1-like transcription factor [Vermiconidia calcicola]|uniref:AP-1-like transcription factor n=1 Tax=Vermiconidia calcicola TaxID=1690605 RepID=A0ACC3NFG7_9PEZI|nr:AP-1-like transcription factor [Vermiconidia calcicola]
MLLGSDHRSKPDEIHAVVIPDVDFFFDVEPDQGRLKVFSESSQGYSPELLLSPTGSDPEEKEQLRRKRRREQNKTAQRAYRGRKAQHMIELQAEIEVLEKHVLTFRSNNRQLEHDVRRMEIENSVLRASMVIDDHTGNVLQKAHAGHEAETPVGRPILLKDALTVYRGWYG